MYPGMRHPQPLWASTTSLSPSRRPGKMRKLGNTWSRSLTRQVPQWHCQGQPDSHPALTLYKECQHSGSPGDTGGGRCPADTEARGQDAAKEEEEAAGLVTPQVGPPGALHPHAGGSCSPSKGTETGFPHRTQPYPCPIPQPCGSPSQGLTPDTAHVPSGSRTRASCAGAAEPSFLPGAREDKGDEERKNRAGGGGGGKADLGGPSLGSRAGGRAGPDPSADVAFAIDPCCTQAH